MIDVVIIITILLNIECFVAINVVRDHLYIL